MATVVGNNIKENIRKDAAINEVFETAKIAGILKETIGRDIQIESVKALELDWNHNPRSVNHQLRYLRHQLFDYTLKVEYLSNVYNCLSLTPPKQYIISDLDTGRIFNYKNTSGCEAFLVE